MFIVCLEIAKRPCIEKICENNSENPIKSEEFYHVTYEIICE